jgi:parallel beta-helix repeat protein
MLGAGQVTGCCATLNGNGIVTGNSGTVAHSTASNNFGTGIAAWYGTVIGCTVRENTTGIEITDGTVSGCTAVANFGDGIHVFFKSQVLQNTCMSNGVASNSAGILVDGDRNRIDGNTVNSNGRGVNVVGTFNVIVRNSASDNGTVLGHNYVIGGSDNDVGPLGQASGATSPWANLQQ